MKKIKLFDLSIRNKKLKKKIDTSIRKILINKNFIKGDEVTQFEKNFKKINNSKYCISCNSGTDALVLILKSINLKKNDEIITTCHSWISTSEAIIQAGAKPIFVDTGEDFNIDPKKILKKINKRTKAILVVHLFGKPCNLNKIISICKKFKLKLIEDCAQAHMSKYNNKCVGTFGYASAFSFFPTKNLGAFGDAGCVLTNSNSLAKKIRMLANHGYLKKHNHILDGYNSRLDTIQAAVLNEKIKYLKQNINYKQKIANVYFRLLSNCKQISIPKNEKNIFHSYYLYTVKAKNRDKLRQWLLKNGIESGFYYPKILPLQKTYKKFNYNKGEFLSANEDLKSMISLPIHINMSLEDAKYCSKKILNFYKKN